MAGRSNEATRGDDREGGDLDLLVDALPGATLFDLGGLQDELETLLGVRADVRTPADLPKDFRGRSSQKHNLYEQKQ